MRAATPYETNVQPAVLGLRRALAPIAKAIVPDPTDPTIYVHPLGMASGPARRGVGAAARGIGDLLDDALRGLRATGDDAIEVVDPRAATAAVNASGESAASLEALGRRAWEQQTGRRLVRLDRGGRETPWIGEPGDVRANPGERIGYRHPDGRFEEITRGRSR